MEDSTEQRGQRHQRRIVGFFIISASIVALVGITLLSVFGVRAFDAPVSAQVGPAELQLTIAETPYQRARGLQHVEMLEPDAGMYFAFEEPGLHTFWMINTLIPLDFLWIADNEVVDITTDVQPEPGVATNQLRRYAPTQPVDAVIELNAGAAEQYGIAIGDSVSLDRAE